MALLIMDMLAKRSVAAVQSFAFTRRSGAGMPTQAGVIVLMAERSHEVTSRAILRCLQTPAQLAP